MIVWLVCALRSRWVVLVVVVVVYVLDVLDVLSAVGRGVGCEVM